MRFLFLESIRVSYYLRGHFCFFIFLFIGVTQRFFLIYIFVF